MSPETRSIVAPVAEADGAETPRTRQDAPPSEGDRPEVGRGTRDRGGVAGPDEARRRAGEGRGRDASALGVVVIGRNEGERLRRCLGSIVGRAPAVVYVDSGSVDGSVDLARSLGAEVVELDMSEPFTAARGRNAGLERLAAIAPGARFVMFVDGDCELIDGWLDRACGELEAHPDWAVACGRLRERSPRRSIYNRLADLEWDTPIGPSKACGGIAMIRAEALRQVGGFNPLLIAGEEPELCVRLRRAGWTIMRIDAEMAMHDIGMTRFAQWWRRAIRGGHAFAEGAALHGRPPERHFVRQSRSATFWGLLVPSAAAGLAWPTRGWSLTLLAGYPLLYHRTRRGALARGFSGADAALYAAACVLGKLPEAIGVARYRLGSLVGRQSGLIEYKGARADGLSSVGAGVPGPAEGVADAAGRESRP
jgi:GT2 family glycosyltransferase